MSAPGKAELDYYAAPGAMTDLSACADVAGSTPAAPEDVASMVQGLLLHPEWAVAYDVEVPDGRRAELQVRSAAVMLDRIVAIDPAPLTEQRSPGKRFLGNCRDYATLTTALLRHHGTPARARCGFAGYFEAGKWVDHWVVEHWNGDRWQLIDPQIDDLQREITGLQDPADLEGGLFLNASEAWQRCQRGEVDGTTFGIFDMWGDWFIASNLGREFAALNKVEMLPWDDWGSLAGDGSNLDRSLCDDLAALVRQAEHQAIVERYASDSRLSVPTVVSSLGPGGEWGPQEVAELVARQRETTGDHKSGHR